MKKLGLNLLVITLSFVSIPAFADLSFLDEMLNRGTIEFVIASNPNDGIIARFYPQNGYNIFKQSKQFRNAAQLMYLHDSIHNDVILNHMADRSKLVLKHMTMKNEKARSLLPHISSEKLIGLSEPKLGYIAKKWSALKTDLKLEKVGDKIKLYLADETTTPTSWKQVAEAETIASALSQLFAPDYEEKPMIESLNQIQRASNSKGVYAVYAAAQNEGQVNLAEMIRQVAGYNGVSPTGEMLDLKELMANYSIIRKKSETEEGRGSTDANFPIPESGYASGSVAK